MEDQSRNLHPADAARVAMIIWGKEYSEKTGGSMDFWDGLSDDQKNMCVQVVTTLNRNT